MSEVGTLKEWGVDLFALQHFTQDPPDLPGGQLLIDGEPYPPEGGGGGSAHTIEDEGVDLPDRGTLNFVGAGVTATDSGTKTVVTIPAYTHPNHSGDVVSVADGATEIQAGVVTNAKLANVATSTIKGRVTASTGDVEDLTATQARTLLNVADGANAGITALTGAVTASGSGSVAATIASDAVTTVKILDANVTNAKMANMTTKTLKGRNTGSTGVPEDVTPIQVQQWRNTTETSNATPSINSDNVGRHSITALAAAITSLTVTGTPFDGQLLWIAITDNGTARAINFGATVEDSTVTMPTTTVISKRLNMLFSWSSATSKWQLVAKA